MDNELRKNVRLRWFESLFELSHYEFQKKVWIEAGIENHVSDYSEAICKYFDDLDLFDTFHHLCKSDVLVMGLSSLSIVAALYNKNKIIYLPYSNPPYLKSWEVYEE